MRRFGKDLLSRYCLGIVLWIVVVEIVVRVVRLVGILVSSIEAR
jgi:hypothetical protein